MCGVVAEHRMRAVAAETGTHPREFERRFQEGSLHVPAARCVEATVLAAVIEPVGLDGLALVDELDGEQPAGAHVLAAGIQRFVDRPERVAALQIAMEIDLTLEGVDDLLCDRIRNLGGVGSCEK